MLVIIRGAGDLATGIALRLKRAHISVIMTDIPAPTAIRRTVAFSQAIVLGETKVEDVTARRAETPEAAMALLQENVVPVLADPEGICIPVLKPDVVVDAIFRGANDLSQQLSQEDPVGSVQGLLGQTRSLLRSCAKTIDAFQAAGQDNSSYRQDLSDLVSNINQNRPDGQEILDTVAQLNRKVHAALDKAHTALDKAFDAAEKFLNGIDVDAQLPEIQENLRDAAQTMGDMGDKLMAWAKSVAVEAGPVGAEAAAAAQRLADSCYQLRDRLNTLADGLKENSALLQDTIALAAQLEKLTDTLLTPVFDDVVNDVKNVLDQSEDLLQGFHGTAADTRDLLAAASAAAGTLDGLMSQGRTAMGQAPC